MGIRSRSLGYLTACPPTWVASACAFVCHKSSLAHFSNVEAFEIIDTFELRPLTFTNEPLSPHDDDRQCILVIHLWLPFYRMLVDCFYSTIMGELYEEKW